MAWEIERKFLVDVQKWRPQSPGVRILQGYLACGADGCVRVRIAGAAARLTVKGPHDGLRRLEFEYPVPIADAESMLERLCKSGIVEKTRYREVHQGRPWDVDVFHGGNAGLVTAEVELPRVDAPVVRPPWVSREVSDDCRYSNSHLARRPFSLWRLEPA